MSEKKTIEEYINENGSLVYTNVGISMMPLLRQGKDVFTIRKKGPERCKVGDVVLYKRPPSSYVLHRIIEVKDDSYVIMGDNCVSKEYGIKDSDIIGIMTDYSRNGKNHTVDEMGYKAYSFTVLHTIPVRRGAKLFIAKAKKTIKKIIKK